MARVGAGSEEFFDTKTKSKWERRAKQQLSKAFQPALTSVAMDWSQPPRLYETLLVKGQITIWSE